MSLILQGIDLPKEGESLKIEILPNGDIWEGQGHSFVTRDTTKAIQIPKGHGRLIDGDELNKSVHTWNPVYTYGRSAFTREIGNAPTILEMEEE